MNAPIIWIIFPLVVSAILLFFLEKSRIVVTIGLITSVFLAIFALFQPIGHVLKLGPISVDIIPELSFFGRAFLLENSDRFTLCLIFFTLTLFIGGLKVANQPAKFVPLSMAIASMMTAALSVQPFLYSAVFVELAVLLMIPLVTVRGAMPEKGVIRFLIYLSMAMPFILFAGWILSGAQASPSDETWRSLAALFLSVGFAQWLAVFPFHSWVSQFSQAVSPYFSGFIFSLYPVVTLLIVLDYVSSLVWLREAGYLSPIIRTVGIIMIVTSGIWAAVERDLKRLLSYTVLYETGFALLLISIQSNSGISLLYQSFVPRILGLSLLGLSLSILTEHRLPLTIDALKSMIKKFPFIILGILISLMGIIGFPLFAGFPYKYESLQMIGGEGASPIIWIMIGMIGFLISAIRVFSSATTPSVEKWEIDESIPEILFLGVGSLILIIIGWFPQIIQVLISGLITNLPVLK